MARRAMMFRSCRAVPVLLVALAGLVSQVSPLRAQALSPASEDTLIHHAGAWMHGPENMYEEVKERVLGDPRALDLYADLLMGRRTSEIEWDTYTALWFLAQRADERYVPVFLEYGREEKPDRSNFGGQFETALYGLVRLAHVPAAAERLDELARNGEPFTQRRVAGYLRVVNDTAARTVLRRIPLDALPPKELAKVREVLAAPGRPDKGTWP